MNKKIVLFFLLFILALSTFAEFIISPSVGYSCVVDNNINHLFDVNFDLGSVGTKGFSFLFNNTITFPNLRFYELSFLLGYTYKGINNLFISVYSGIASVPKDLTIGAPLRLGFDYYFKKHIGITFSVTDSVHYNFANKKFNNIFKFSIGTIFKFENRLSY